MDGIIRRYPRNKLQTEKYLQLRLLVGFLGEQSQHNWWSSNFLTAANAAFLQPVFTKTYRLAQYNGLTEAVRRVHDEYIGLGNAYHLFRFPEDIEQNIYQLMLREENFDQQFFANLDTKESALSLLSSFSKTDILTNEGPILIGRINAISSGESLKKISQTYVKAFKSNIKSYPYFAN